MFNYSDLIAPSRSLAVFVPRGLRLREAALYVGLRQTKFLAGVRAGDFPAPRKLGGAVIWDRLDLDAAFDRLPLRPPPVSEDVAASDAAEPAP